MQIACVVVVRVIVDGVLGVIVDVLIGLDEVRVIYVAIFVVISVTGDVLFTIHVTDHGRRAELQRAETEEIELLAGVGFVSVGREIERPSKFSSVLTRRRSCRRPFLRIGQRKTHVFLYVQRYKKKTQYKYFELETKSLKPNSKNRRTIARRSGTLL